MKEELQAIFDSTLEAHYSARLGIDREGYRSEFEAALAEEVRDAPVLEVTKGSLAVYVKLGVLVLAMLRVYLNHGLQEEEIGELIYRTGEAHFALPPLKRAIRRALFFSAINIGQVKKRARDSELRPGGLCGFKLKYLQGRHKDEFGVEYTRCGICDHFSKKGMLRFAKYCCLVDYAIMGSLGISLSRTRTMANGAACCDFRFSKVGISRAGWPPSGLQEWMPRYPD
jgi:hypothetical protein